MGPVTERLYAPQPDNLLRNNMVTDSLGGAHRCIPKLVCVVCGVWCGGNTWQQGQRASGLASAPDLTRPLL